ncbi:MAG: HU family DNA-binding protein [Candidatus Goldiibacteriota bacterium]
MTKIEIVDKIGENVALPKKDIEKVLDHFVKIAQGALDEGKKVSVTGLGSFTIKERKGRLARNPKTGEKVDVPPKKVVKFKPGKELTEILQASMDKKTADASAQQQAPEQQ